MLPYILAVVGGYLIGDSRIKKFARGGLASGRYVDYGAYFENERTSARKWVDKVVAERGYNKAYQLLKYNVTENPYFKESHDWIMAAWQRLNEINPS